MHVPALSWHMLCGQLKASVELAPRPDECLMKFCCCSMEMLSLRGVGDKDWLEPASRFVFQLPLCYSEQSGHSV